VNSLKVNLFGEFRVQRGEELIESKEWDRQKTRSLLKLLLTRPGHVFSRDEIIESLWPGVSPKSAEKSLRVTVSLLRRALEPELGRGTDSRYVLQRQPGYTFDCRADCWVDAWEFEERCRTAEAARKAGDLDKALDEYRTALGLVGGEFLAEEPYEEWAMEPRYEFEDRQRAVLTGLSECLAQKGQYTEAIETCEKALSLDGYGEELHRRLMLYHYCAGDQAHALQAYRSYAATLQEELDAGPSPGLTRLREQIEARDVPGVDELRRYPRPRRPLKLPYSLSRTQFAGRDEEYAWLVERLREVRGRRGDAVAVEGEAGVGKTRLVEEFLGYARSQGVRVLSGRCYERELGPPLEPVLDALAPASDIMEMSPELSDRREEELGYRRPGGSYDASRVYHALARECIGRTRNGGEEGLILFVDDVQWADRATLDFLSYLAKRIHDEKVLLVFAYRREHTPELSGWLEQLADRRVVSALSLNRLSPGDLGKILGRMSSRTFGGLPSLTAFLYRESEGNPFYAVEYLRWLIEAGTVEIDSRRRISGMKDDALQENVLPSGVRSLIKARFSGLDKEAREVVELAAVVGRSFDLNLLSNAGIRGEARVADLMESLMSSWLIIQNPATEGTYYFSHDKLRQALYEDISTARRRELHLRMAGAIEKDGSEPAELAHHYLQAREWRPALENLVRAAEKAEESYAWDTASENYARALEVAEKLPGYEEKRFELLSARERFLEHMDRRKERAAAVQEMFELAELLNNRAWIAETHVRRIGVSMSLLDPKGAEEAGRAALAIFRELGDKAGEARAHRELGYVRWVNRDHAAALEANLQALWIHRELGHRMAAAGVAGNIAHVYRGMNDFDSAIRWNEEALQIDRELGDRLGEAFRLNSMANINRERGDLEATLSLHLESLEITGEIGAKNLQVTQHVNCGTMYLSLGDPEAALEHFQSAVRISRETGYTRDEGYSLMSVGAALEQAGDPAGAVDAYRQAIELLQRAYEESETPKELHGKADALTLLGTVLHRSLDHLEEARNAYEEAASIYRKLGEGLRLRKLLMNLAGLYWRTGDSERSAQDYEEALDLAREHEEAAHEAAALASLGVVYRELDRLRESVRCGKEAVELLRDLEDSQAEAYVLSSLAETYRRLGHYPSALSQLKRSLRLRRTVGDLEGEICVLHDLAGIYEKLDIPDKSQEVKEEAMSKKTQLETLKIYPIVERSS
jgi:predicted ATPase/DNA-binding SARP family transcriptional activator